MKRYEKYKPSGVDWIGEIPEHWDLVLLKRKLDGLKDGTHGTYLRTNKGRPLLSAKNVYFDGIKISDNESLISEENHDEIVKNGYPQYGDLLLTIVGTIGRCFVYNLEYPLAFQRSVLFLRFKKRVNPKYYYYFFQSPLFSNRLLSLAKTSAQSGVYMNDVAESIVLELPKQEQTAIANYLDEKTAQIDDLIAKKQRLIDLLNEEKTATINQAVTKGLNTDAPMRDSGISWLEEIPANWEVKKLKYLAWAINEKTEYDIEFKISLENIESKTGRLISLENENNFQGELRKFQKGDVLFNKLRPYLAKAYLADKNGGCLGELLIFRSKGELIPTFLFYRVLSYDFIKIVDSSTYGSKMPRASWDDFISQLLIPYPQNGEQTAIANYLDRKTDQMDDVISKTHHEIELLQEYRTALISEAVTGKIDVRI
ncbi:MAG: restriction endonuclease subunit S [Deltaproteobacteria bacterium CG03_land_8_20_14_0_80_45_14]|nr:MAG: restriction endonuclease subunit S [Deltaproteobacteria bacterium CG03_land_8_20_14_0_80_45_14]